MKSIRKILVGYDGSPSAKQMMIDLPLAGLPKIASATVLSAADVFLWPKPNASTSPSIRTSIEQARKVAQEHLRDAEVLSQEGRRRLKSIFPKWKVMPAWKADTPAWALIKKADAWKADLIVVGAHGHSQLGRFLGSVSQMVLVHSAQSVRIARPRLQKKSEPQKIIVGFDGSAGARAALESVATRKWKQPLHVFLVTVIPRKNDERVSIGRWLEAHAKPLRDQGAIVTCLVEVGDPKHVLIKLAADWRVDCIFLGARGLTNVKRFLIGGVTSAVAARANCSVEIVRTKPALSKR